MTIDHSKKLRGYKIAGSYSISGEIGEGAMGRVYRAIPFDDPSRTVAIKVIDAGRKLDTEELLRFQKEAAVMSQLHHPNIICFHDMGILDHDSEGLGQGYYIVMEMAEGENLKQIISKNLKSDLNFFFQIGAQVASSLDYTHSKNIVHRDIKPQNIVIVESGDGSSKVNVKVLDFGIANLSQNIISALKDQNLVSDEIAGTPTYMAPEQANPSLGKVDHRVDLYALGCVLYEVLTGRPPFIGNNKRVLQQMHATEKPKSIIEIRSEIPEVINNIVMRLLEKDPDDRYPTAFSLHADLVKVRDIILTQGQDSVSTFSLGDADHFLTTTSAIPMVGRDDITASLVDGFNNVNKENGRSHICMIHGDAGIGKTRLVSEFRKHLIKSGINHIHSQFSFHENGLHFNAISNAFNEYLINVLKNQPKEADRLWVKFGNTLGEDVVHIAAVIPAIQLFYDEEKITSDEMVDSGEALVNTDFKRFTKHFSDFVACMTESDTPLVFIFDDMQWADEKTISLIDAVFSYNNSQKFYIIGTYRSETNYLSEMFFGFLEKFRKLKRRFKQLNLAELDHENIRFIIESMLGDEIKFGNDVVDFIEKRSKGNPNLVIENLKAMISSQQLESHSSGRGLKLEVREIGANLIEVDSIDVILSKTRNYDGVMRRVLEVAAVIGQSFYYETLSIQNHIAATDLSFSIRKLISDGVISPIPGVSELKYLGAAYAFRHQKIRDVICEGIHPRDRRILHFQIAAKIESIVSVPNNQIIFSLAHHFKLSSAKLDEMDLATLEKMALYSKRSGEISYSERNYIAAERYFEDAFNALILLSEDRDIAENILEVLDIQTSLLASQGRFAKALNLYKKSEHLVNNKPFENYVLGRRLYVSRLTGGISSVLGAIDKRLESTNLPKIDESMLSNILHFALSIVSEYFLKSMVNKSFGKKYRESYLRSQSRTRVNIRTFPLHMYRTGFWLSLRSGPYKALTYLNTIWKVVNDSAIELDDKEFARSIVDRAYFFSRFKLWKLGSYYFGLIDKLSKKRKWADVYGYSKLMRLLSVDYASNDQKAKSDSYRSAKSTISPELGLEEYVTLLSYEVFELFFKGRFDRLNAKVADIEALLPTKHWLVARAKSISLYSFLLQGDLNRVIREGESYLKRRVTEHSNKNDIFEIISSVIINFAKADSGLTRSSYLKALATFHYSKSKNIIFEIEADFAKFFIYTFSWLYSYETGNELMRASEQKKMMSLLAKGELSLFNERSTVKYAMLMNRYLRKKVLRASPIKEVIRMSRRDRYAIVEVFSNLLMSEVVMARRGTSTSRYLLSAHKLTNELGFGFLTKVVEFYLEKYHFDYKKGNAESIGGAKIESETAKKFIYNQLSVFGVGFERGLSAAEIYGESISRLKKEFEFSDVRVFTELSPGKVIQTYPESDSMTGAYVSSVTPYVDINMILPLSNGLSTDGNASHFDEESSESTLVSSNDSTAIIQSSMDGTAVISSNTLNEMTAVNGTVVPASELSEAGANVTSSPRKSDLLIPVVGGGRKELILISDLSLSYKVVKNLDSEFKTLGALYGLIGDVFADADKFQSYKYEPARFDVESCSWLNIWNKGKMRRNRETSWYQGFSLNDNQYFLVYLSLQGPSGICEEVSRNFWYLVKMLSNIVARNPNGSYEFGILKDLFHDFVSSTESIQFLENVAISFSLFEKNVKLCKTGHFGHCRPAILGVKSDIKAYNQVVCSFRNKSALRYWKITTSLEKPHVYMLSYNTTNLQVKNDASVISNTFKSTNILRSSDDFHDLVASFLPGEKIPRYYVGVIMNLLENNLENSEVIKDAQ